MMPRYLPPSLKPAQIHLGRIPTGYLGTVQTVEHIKELIRQGSKDFFVRQKAIDILLENKVEPKQYMAEIETLFRWVQKNIRYTKDPFQVEVLHSARRMLELRAGDCDDMAILLGSMLKSIGHPVRLVLAGFDPARPNQYSHIYLEVLYKNRWIPLDATMPFAAGWSPPSSSRKVFPIQKESQGLGQFPGLGKQGQQQSKSTSRGQRHSNPNLNADKLYYRFRRSTPSQYLRMSHQRIIPPTVVHLGSLVGIIYRSNRGDGKTNAYIHFMEKPPLLVSNPEGNQLYIVGGKYKVTERGIEG
jgi:hypothetical protein